MKRFLESDEPYKSMEIETKNRSNVQFAVELDESENALNSQYNTNSNVRLLKSNMKKGKSSNMFLDSNLEDSAGRKKFYKNDRSRKADAKTGLKKGQIRAKSHNMRGSMTRSQNRVPKIKNGKKSMQNRNSYMDKLKQRTSGRKPHWGTSSTRRPVQKGSKSQVQTRALSQKRRKRDRTPNLNASKRDTENNRNNKSNNRSHKKRPFGSEAQNGKSSNLNGKKYFDEMDRQKKEKRGEVKGVNRRSFERSDSECEEEGVGEAEHRRIRKLEKTVSPKGLKQSLSEAKREFEIKIGLVKRKKKMVRGRLEEREKERKKRRFVAKSTNKFGRRPLVARTMYEKVGFEDIGWIGYELGLFERR